MSPRARTRVVFLVAIFAIAASVWTGSQLQKEALEESLSESLAAHQMLVAGLEQEADLRGFALSRGRSFIVSYRKGKRDFEAALRQAEVGSVSDPGELRALNAQALAISRWQTLAESEIARIRRIGPNSVSLHAVLVRMRVFAEFRAENRRLQALLREESASHLDQAGLISKGLVFVLVLISGGGYLLIERRRRAATLHEEAEQRYRDTQFGFTQAMQVTRSEAEAYMLLKRHLERSIANSDVIVLNRNNSDNRLEAATPLPHDSPLRQKLKGAEPGSCLAVRLASPHARDDSQPLMECEVCRTLPGRSTCIPSLVGGEVIGSVLVCHEDRFQPDHDHRVQDSVTQAAPVLANLRNLELAKFRAATDALTGLDNVRTMRETLKRMVAQAGRTLEPMSVALMDLDHFKQINDTQGHAKGDDVLAAVGDMLSSRVRGSDFVSRYGGEEFVVLMPGTDQPGAAGVAEKLRRAISEITISSLDRTITASFGVASYPADATDAETLLRAADRALYVAKEKGRDRVEVATQIVPAALA